MKVLQQVLQQETTVVDVRGAGSTLEDVTAVGTASVDGRGAGSTLESLTLSALWFSTKPTS